MHLDKSLPFGRVVENSSAGGMGFKFTGSVYYHCIFGFHRVCMILSLLNLDHGGRNRARGDIGVRDRIGMWLRSLHFVFTIVQIILVFGHTVDKIVTTKVVLHVKKCDSGDRGNGEFHKT